MKLRLYVLGALVLTLVISGGSFAYSWTSGKVTIGVSAEGNYALVQPKDTLSIDHVFGDCRGSLPSGRLFEITPDSNYTGDLLVKVYLTNTDELSRVYEHLNLKLTLTDKNGAVRFPTRNGADFQLLTLDNGRVILEMYGYNTAVDCPWYVKLTGGSYSTRSAGQWGGGYEAEPALYCEVTQR